MQKLLLFIASCLFVGSASGDQANCWKWSDFSEKVKETLKSRYRIDETVFQERYSTLPKDEYDEKGLAKIFREHLSVMLEEALQDEAESAKRIGELIAQQKREDEANKGKPKKYVTIRSEFIEKMEQGYLHDLYIAANVDKAFSDPKDREEFLEEFNKRWPAAEDYSTLKSTWVEDEDVVGSPYYTWNNFTSNTKLIFAEHGINQKIFEEKYSKIAKNDDEEKVMKILLGKNWGQGKYFICNDQLSGCEKINLKKIPVTTTDFDIQKKVKKTQSKKKAPKKDNIATEYDVFGKSYPCLGVIGQYSVAVETENLSSIESNFGKKYKDYSKVNRLDKDFEKAYESKYLTQKAYDLL